MKVKLITLITLIFSACHIDNTNSDSTGITPQKGDIVITELMPNTVVEDVDWIEFYNSTSTAVNLKGCSLSDDGGDKLIIDQSLMIPPNEYVVIVGGANEETNLPSSLSEPAFQFSKEQFSLSSEADQVILTCGGIMIDKVAYDAYVPGPATSSRGWQLDPNSLDAQLNDDNSKWCYSLLSDDNIYGENRVATPGQENTICSEIFFPYAYINNQQAALIEGIDFETTLRIAKEEFTRKLVTSELTIWAIRDQEITPAIAKTIAQLYFDNIEMLYGTEPFTLLDWNHAVWHFGWAIANLYRNGNDSVKAELQAAYEDAKKRPQTLERHSLIAMDHINGPNILMGDIHEMAHAYAVTHIVVPGNAEYIQSYEEYLDARRSDLATRLIHFLYRAKRIFGQPPILRLLV